MSPSVYHGNPVNFLVKTMHVVANRKLTARPIAVAHHRKTGQLFNMV
jgi:hypothetical protein